MLTPALTLALAGALTQGLACTPRSGPDARDGPADSAAAAAPSGDSIRFEIRAAPGAEGPVYVVLHEEDGQAGWVTVRVDGTRMYLRERCEIADCGKPPVVCGMALRMIRDLTFDDGRAISLPWDGKTSRIAAASGCEARIPAPGGAYVARFCYSRQAEFDSHMDAGRDAPGRLIDPTCVDRPFTSAEQLVELVVE